MARGFHVVEYYTQVRHYIAWNKIISYQGRVHHKASYKNYLKFHFHLNDCLTVVVYWRKKNISLRYGEPLLGKVKMKKVVIYPI